MAKSVTTPIWYRYLLRQRRVTAMTIDDKTRTELEAAVFRRLVEHLRSRTDVQNIDLMNLAGFCRNCLSNWLKEEADARGAAMTKDESREAVYGMPYETWKSIHQGSASPEQLAAMKNGPSGHCREGDEHAVRVGAAAPRPGGGVRDPLASPRNDCSAFSCGRAVDERDVALTGSAPILRVISRMRRVGKRAALLLTPQPSVPSRSTRWPPPLLPSRKRPRQNSPRTSSRPSSSASSGSKKRRRPSRTTSAMSMRKPRATASTSRRCALS